jgi:hypothetical protein
MATACAVEGSMHGRMRERGSCVFPLSCLARWARIISVFGATFV